MNRFKDFGMEEKNSLWLGLTKHKLDIKDKILSYNRKIDELSLMIKEIEKSNEEEEL